MRKTKKVVPAADPTVMQLTEVESLRWGKLDAEIRNLLQGARLEELEIEALNRLYVAQKQTRETMKQSYLRDVERLKKEYVEFTQRLAEKYHVDPKKMTIDPDTGVIREI